MDDISHRRLNWVILPFTQRVFKTVSRCDRSSIRCNCVWFSWGSSFLLSWTRWSSAIACGCDLETIDAFNNETKSFNSSSNEGSSLNKLYLTKLRKWWWRQSYLLVLPSRININVHNFVRDVDVVRNLTGYETLLEITLPNCSWCNICSNVSWSNRENISWWYE